ncbi:MAG: Class III aminotransferase [Parcubacteria group bacterium GW2011_GWA2_47_64]|nr:MAG: Class III aminotransferase [Parcubacteria group bacterium GW2011_GWA2_47_64]
MEDAKGLNEHLLSGLEPAGVPSELRGTVLPFAYNRIEELEALLSRHKDIGTIVVETVRHHEPERGFLEKVRALATKAGAVLIFDEITVGWRITLGGAHLHYGVYPDIAVLGKAIANGYAMAAIIGREGVMDSVQKTFISSTFWTERIGPVAAIATIKEMKRVNLPAYLKRVGTLIGEGWRQAAERHWLKIRVHGPEALVGFAFDYGEKSQAIRTLFTQEMLRRGFLASGSVYMSHAHTEKNIKKYLSAVNEVFALLAEAIEKDTVASLLQGPVAHSGFQRLT